MCRNQLSGLFTPIPGKCLSCSSCYGCLSGTPAIREETPKDVNSGKCSECNPWGHLLARGRICWGRFLFVTAHLKRISCHGECSVSASGAGEGEAGRHGTGAVPASSSLGLCAELFCSGARAERLLWSRPIGSACVSLQRCRLPVYLEAGASVGRTWKGPVWPQPSTEAVTPAVMGT